MVNPQCMELKLFFILREERLLLSPVRCVIRPLALLPVHMSHIVRILLLELVQPHNLRKHPLRYHERFLSSEAQAASIGRMTPMSTMGVDAGKCDGTIRCGGLRT